MPNNAGNEPFPFTSFTMERESDIIIRDLTFKEAACITAERMVMASAISAEDTWDRDSHKGSSCRQEDPEKTPPMPQFPERASHTASTLQTVILGGMGGALGAQGRPGIPEDGAVEVWSPSCADCHSLASEMNFIMISILEKVLFSKQSLFLAFQVFHKSQGHGDTCNLTGGRTVRDAIFEIKVGMEGVIAAGQRSQIPDLISDPTV